MIRRSRIRLAAALALIGLIAVASNGAVAAKEKTIDIAPFVQQVGTYDYLASPNYQGLLPISSILKGTTIGLGTFANLDGEMVVLNGIVYRVGIDGVPSKASTKRLTPFMQAVNFDPQKSTRLAPNTACSALPQVIDQLVKSTVGIVAVRLSGVFFDVETRSVQAQLPPYPTLANAVSTQTKFSLGRVNATLVGFRQGPDAQGIGAPGLHLHGLTKSLAAGGHVLSCVTGPNVLLEVEKTQGVRVHTP